MKKLIIAAVVMTVAVVASAANVNWTLTSFYTPLATAAGTITVKSDSNSTGSKSPAGQIAFSLYVIDYSSGSAGAETLLDGKTVTFSEAGKMASTTLFAQADAVTMRDTYGDASGNLYLVLKGSYSDPKYTYAYQSQVSKNLSNILSGAQTYTFMGTTAGAWTATAAPEPTSGLMLLLGVGLMALKRKRA